MCLTALVVKPLARRTRTMHQTAVSDARSCTYCTVICMYTVYQYRRLFVPCRILYLTCRAVYCALRVVHCTVPYVSCTLLYLIFCALSCTVPTSSGLLTPSTGEVAGRGAPCK
jgi:hypothetical protein